MDAAAWWSQPFPPEGAITSEGIRNQLGRPPVDPLTVFVRESAQNSWDARTRSGPVHYMLDVEEVPSSFLPAWRRLFSAGVVEGGYLPLPGVLKDGLRILAVSDRGTKGLGGPTRADVAPHGARDWISFVLNVGERRDTTGGGGTYGYGKAVFYRLSRVGTVLIHTRTCYEGRPVTRLIGVALGESYVHGDVPYTGRHWWGAHRGDHVEPLVDEEAAAVVRELGIPEFGDDETGTTIIVVEPDFGDVGDDLAVARRLADTIAWQLWPLLLPERGDDRLDPIVTCRGEDYAVPDAATTYPLDMFVRAYRQTKGGQSRVIETQRPPRKLGTLGLYRRAISPGREASAAAKAAGIGGDPHHVCLLRTPELVVKYLEGPEPFSAASAYAGVFRAEDDLDDVFAAAEPPTHDDWVADQMTGEQKTFVRQARIKVLTEVKEFVRPATIGATTDRVPLGAASNFLGSLVAVGGEGGARFTIPGTSSSSVGATAGGGTGRNGGSGGGERGGRGGASGAPRTRASLIGEPVWERYYDELVLVQDVTVPRGVAAARLRASVVVRTADGSREAEPPIGAAAPEVVGWERDGTLVVGDEIDVDAGTDLRLVVRPADDALIEIDVTATVRENDA